MEFSLNFLLCYSILAEISLFPFCICIRVKVFRLSLRQRRSCARAYRSWMWRICHSLSLSHFRDFQTDLGVSAGWAPQRHFIFIIRWRSFTATLVWLRLVSLTWFLLHQPLDFWLGLFSPWYMMKLPAAARQQRNTYHYRTKETSLEVEKLHTHLEFIAVICSDLWRHRWVPSIAYTQPISSSSHPDAAFSPALPLDFVCCCYAHPFGSLSCQCDHQPFGLKLISLQWDHPYLGLQGVKLEPFQSHSLCIEFTKRRIPKKLFVIAIVCTCSFFPPKFLFHSNCQNLKKQKQLSDKINFL